MGNILREKSTYSFTPVPLHVHSKQMLISLQFYSHRCSNCSQTFDGVHTLSTKILSYLQNPSHIIIQKGSLAVRSVGGAVFVSAPDLSPSPHRRRRGKRRRRRRRRRSSRVAAKRSALHSLAQWRDRKSGGMGMLFVVWTP